MNQSLPIQISNTDDIDNDAVQGNDIVDALAAIPAQGSVDRLRRAREQVRTATQASFEALFEPAQSDGLTLAERELVALRVAFLQEDEALAGFHRERAQARGASAGLLFAAEQLLANPQAERRWHALLRFADRLTLDPGAAHAGDLQVLQQAGLSARDIVTLAQLIAFSNYQVRLLAGLRALKSRRVQAVRLPASAQVLLAGHHPAPERRRVPVTFTLEALAWASWLPTVDPAQASAEQMAVLDESNAAARSSPYYLTLVHNAPVLRQRSRLFNAIMYGQGGLPRADRELTTLGVSLVNGCPYCASVHGRLFAQLSKEPQVAQALFDDGVNVALAPRRRALIDLAVALSANPPGPLQGRIAAARAAGLDDEQILDAIHCAAIFAWANRLMQTLGEPSASADR
jgi:CMD domain protein